MQTSHFLSFPSTIPEAGSFLDISPANHMPRTPVMFNHNPVGSLDFEMHSSTWLQKDIDDTSRVLLFKGLPEDICEAELLSFCQPFGLVKDILLKRHTHCAFLQFDRIEQAQNCCDHFTKLTPAIRGCYIYVCYNGTDKISKPPNAGLPSRFLLVSFSKSGFSPDSNIIAQILSPYGRCVRVVLLHTKNNQAIIEMEDVYQAITVKDSLDNQMVYNLAYVSIQYTEEQEILNQKKQLGSTSGLSTVGTLTGGGTLDHLSPTYSMGRSNLSFGSLWNESLNQGQAQCAWPSMQNQHNKIPRKSSHFSNESKMSRTSLPNTDMPIAPIKDNLSNNNAISIKPVNMNSPLVHLKEEKSPTILLLKNLPKGLKAKMLFRLFGMYGNVLKVKIFFKNPENALIEYQTPEQTELAKSYLNNCPVYGNNMFVTNSKVGVNIDTSTIKKNEDSQFTGEYTNSPEHRYKFSGSKNHLNIAAPSKVIHLSNLCDDKDESFYADLFKELGTISRFMFMKGPERMALMEMSNVEEAVKVLMNFHNFNINGKYLKVSFSKYNKVKDI